MSSDPLLLDLNCDLGEGEPPERTRSLMTWITSANIACGGHAGDEESMVRCLALARELGVRAGAHPGWPDRLTGGRGAIDTVTGGTLEGLVREQVGRLAGLATSQGTRLRHLKLHGALYHVVEADPGLARVLVELVGREWPGLIVFGRAGGAVVAAARQAGVEAWPEAFLDRGYRDDGTLVPRDEPGALLRRLDEALERLADLSNGRGVCSVTGRRLAIEARTACIHGDSPGAIEWLEALRSRIGRSCRRRREDTPAT